VRVAVIGAGLGGLAAACHLAGRNHEVVVLERASVPGGRAGLIEQQGFRFDTGPTVLTMTGILAEAFSAAGCDMNEMLSLQPLDPMYRAVFPDGSTLHCRFGVEQMREEIRMQCSAKDAAAFDRFVAWLTELYALEVPNFIDRNFDSPLDLARPPSAMAKLLQLGGLRKLSKTVNSYFDDERLQRLFSFQAMYAGLSPFQALSIYAVITYMDCVQGVYFPVGGMHAVSQALADAAVKAGATFSYDTDVQRILRSPSGSVTGVQLANGEVIQADAVVANPDLPVAYRTLLDGLPAPRIARTGHYSPSCTVMLSGRSGAAPAEAAHHNIHFGGQWKEAFTALLKTGRPMPDPSILVTLPSLSDSALAPAGKHTMYALEPMPNLDGAINWEREGEALHQRLRESIRRAGYTAEVEVEHVLDPPAWERLGMERGTPFALSHRFFQTGPFRPANTDSRVPGLVFTGSGTTPGVGVPMVLLSGKHAAERVEQLGKR
jgi:phytoene desaturase